MNMELPNKFVLEQNHPNPFNPTTKICYATPIPGNVKLAVYDIMEREITTIFEGYKQAGTYEIEFNASGLAGGVYFYRFSSHQQAITRKLILSK